MGIKPLLQFPHPLRAGPAQLTLLLFLLAPSSYQFCVGSYIIFCWSGLPVCSQVVFCMHVCVWRCITDVPMVRDVLHVHLLLCHLLLSLRFCIKNWCGRLEFAFQISTIFRPHINEKWSPPQVSLYPVKKICNHDRFLKTFYQKRKE